MFCKCVLALVIVHLYGSCCESIKELLQTYEDFVNTSITLDKSDRMLINSWTEHWQVSQVNVTLKYRLQMARHKDHSFMKTNDKWKKCMDLHKIEITTSESSYYEHENDCLRSANLAQDKIKAVHQVEKEIRKWRKGYKYLLKLCNSSNDTENAGICLIQYMQKDNYDITFQRLISLKLRTVGELFLELNASLLKLEECLQTQLSAYLESIRSLMEVLNKCYRWRQTQE